MIDPTATQPVTVRCVCPPKGGAPRHPEDTIHVRSQFGYGDTLYLSKKSVQYKVGMHKDAPVVLPYNDAFMQHEALLEMSVKAWTLEDENGPIPVALSSILLLPEDVGDQVATAVNGFYEASKVPVPNGSGAPSPASSAESPVAPPNRATRRSRKLSTQS